MVFVKSRFAKFNVRIEIVESALAQVVAKLVSGPRYGVSNFRDWQERSSNRHGQGLLSCQSDVVPFVLSTQTALNQLCSRMKYTLAQRAHQGNTDFVNPSIHVISMQ